MGRKGPKADVVAAELDKLRGKQTDGKINLADAAYIKRALDEGVIKWTSVHYTIDIAAMASTIGSIPHEIFYKVLEDAGHRENHTLTDVRIALGAFTCALAAIAQFYSGKFPDTKWVLVICVNLYILATILQSVLLGRIGGDLFFQSHMKGGGVLCAISKMARYSEDYEMGLSRRDSIWSKREKTLPQAQTVTNVTLYFDTEGQLLENKLKKVVHTLLKDLEKSYTRKLN